MTERYLVRIEAVLSPRGTYRTWVETLAHNEAEARMNAETTARREIGKEIKSIKSKVVADPRGTIGGLTSGAERGKLT